MSTTMKDPVTLLPYHSQEKIFHDIVVISSTAVWQEACRKHNDSIQTITIVSCGKKNKKGIFIFVKGS